MKTNSTLWNEIKYYNIPEFTILGLILYIIRDLVVTLVCMSSDISYLSPLYNLYEFTVYFVLFGIWFILTFVTIRQKLYFRKTGRNFIKDNHKYKRTFTELVDYFRDAEPHRLDTSSFAEKNWRKATGIILGRDGKKLIQIPTNCESNISIMGPPGSGKTTGFAISNAVKFRGSVLAIDIKGDIYNYTKKHRKILRFCPDHPDALTVSYHFNPLAHINEMNCTERKLYIESMGTVLIPDQNGSSDSNYFSSRARKYFQGITHMMLHDNPDTTFPDIVHAILKGNYADWVFKARETECIEAAELLLSFEGNSEKNVSSAYDALCTAMTSYSNPVLDTLLKGDKRCISMECLEKGYDVYLQISQEHLNVYAPLFTLIVQSFSTAFSKRKDSSTGIKNRPILMLLDEFPQMTFSYELINKNLSTLRSKSVIIAMLQQNRSQLEYKYTPIGTSSILGNCNYQLILGSNDPSSSEQYSKMFGLKKVLKIGNNVTHAEKASSGKNIQEAREPVFYPEDFGDLDATNEMILYAKGKYCRCQKINVIKD